MPVVLRWLPALLAAISFAWGWTHVVHVLGLRSAPSGWRLTQPDVPVVAGTEHALGEGGGWVLTDHAAFASDAGGPLSARVQVPEDGRLELVQTTRAGDVALVLDRQGEARSGVVVRSPKGRWIPCDGELPDVGDAAVDVALDVGGGVTASVAGVTVRCTGLDVPAPHARAVRGSVQRARVLELDGQAAPSRPWGIFGGLAFVLGALVLGAARMLGDRARWLPVALAPVLLSGPLAHAEGAVLREALRVPAARPLVTLVLAPVAAAACLVLAGLLWELSRRGRGPVGALVSAVTFAGAGWLYASTGSAVALGAGVGGALAAVIELNVRRPRGFNIASLALLVLGLVGCEALVRQGDLAGTWRGLSVAQRAQIERDYDWLNEHREYSQYPMSGYPIEPPPRTAPIRVVALGGSSTGGAFTDDNLDAFYPAVLDRRIEGLQVVNQGVGGWTTLHVRRYLETNVERVDPDIVVLYVGHNDRMTESPVPYKQVFGQLDAGASTSLSLALADVRLYQGFRFLVRTVAGTGVGVAVPVEDTRDNLVAMIDLMRGRGGQVLLVREAVATGAALLEPYGRMMRSLEAPDVAFADAARALESPTATGLFVDNVHLSASGHEALAQVLHDRLNELGWLDREVPEAPAPPERAGD